MLSTNKNISILGIAPYCFLPAVNGGHKAIEQLYRNIGQYAETIVVSTKNNSEECTANYRLIKLFSNSLLHYINVFYYLRLTTLIREQKITHILMEHPYMGWFGLLLKNKKAGVKFIVRSHNIEAIRFKSLNKSWWKILWHYEKWVYNNADLVFFITEEDKNYAVQQYHLPKQKGGILTYGTTQKEIPTASMRGAARNEICKSHAIPASHTILLFNGDLAYAPNKHAVDVILSQINPLLLQHQNFKYTILICGRNLSDEYRKRIEKESKNIIYTGFVDDIIPYFLAADVFINPVIYGGGIKTKLVEALSFNCNAVSTESGATGIPVDVVKNKLQIVEDNDWKSFVSAIISSDVNTQTTESFYEHFYWGNIARKVVNTLEGI